MSYLSGNTRTGLALETIGQTLQTIRETGERRGVDQVAVIITDGRSQDDVVKPALALREAGVKVFAIGVTDITSYKELTEIASYPEQDHIYIVESYGMIDSIKVSLLKKICSDVSGTFRGPEDDTDYSIYGSGEEVTLEF